ATSAKRIASKDIAKVTKDILKAHILKACSTTASVNALMAKLVVSLSLLIVTQYFISLRRFFKLLFCFRIIRIPIRMELHSPLTIGLLDFFIRCVFTDTLNYLVVAFRHETLTYLKFTRLLLLLHGGWYDRPCDSHFQ